MEERERSPDGGDQPEEENRGENDGTSRGTEAKLHSSHRIHRVNVPGTPEKNLNVLLMTPHEVVPKVFGHLIISLFFYCFKASHRTLMYICGNLCPTKCSGLFTSGSDAEIYIMSPHVQCSESYCRAEIHLRL